MRNFENSHWKNVQCDNVYRPDIFYLQLPKYVSGDQVT